VEEEVESEEESGEEGTRWIPLQRETPSCFGGFQIFPEKE